jgi:hypothetical protein
LLAAEGIEIGCASWNDGLLRLSKTIVLVTWLKRPPALSGSIMALECLNVADDMNSLPW